MNLSYETLDQIADAVVPTFAVIALLCPILKSPNRFRSTYFVALLLSGLITTGLRVVNHSEHALWPLLGVNYSGHTGLFMVLGVSICYWRPRWSWGVTPVFLAYVVLMLYQKYHTVGDIALTAIVMGPVTYGVQVGLERIWRRRRGPLEVVNN